MTPERVVEIAERLHEEYGSHIEGNRPPEWGIVRTIISQNTNSANTKKGFERLRERFGTIEELADGEREEIAEALKPAGLYNQKSKRIKKVANYIVEEGGLAGKMEAPGEARRAMMELPGVGPKTADVTLAFSAGMPIVPVDTHVDRITKRLGVAPEGADYDEIRRSWEKVLPRSLMPHVHIDLIEHGRKVCSARNPRCGDCLLNDLCEWSKKEGHGYEE